MSWLPVAARFAKTKAVSLIKVWPPRARDITRATMCLARPSTSTGLAPRATSSALFSRSTTSPRWMPALAARGTPYRSPSSFKAEWYASAYWVAAIGRWKRKRKPSVLSISCPPWAARRSRASRSWAAKSSAARSSPRLSSSLVLSTRSVSIMVLMLALPLRLACFTSTGALVPVSLTGPMVPSTGVRI